MLPVTDYTVLVLCGPLAALATVWLSERIGIPYPTLLIGVGALLSFVPWIPTPDVPPQVVFYVFLPPLLYHAALHIAPEDLHVNARTIGLLSVGLVVVTAAAVAGVVFLIAGVSLVVALVAGVVVAPTDPVSATSVFRRLSAPQRLSTVAEAEGLTNDGTALVLYEAAVGTAVVGTVQPGHLVVTLLVAPAGGVTLGLAIAWLLVHLRRRMDQPVLQITVSLATPYLAYTAAQAIHLSGILATVTAGVYVGTRLSHIYSPGARLQAMAFLDVLVFLLNAVLFTLVGVQLDRKVHAVPGESLPRILLTLAVVVAVLIALRMVWMLTGPAIARLRGHPAGKQAWRERTILGWAGMRGGVSLAAALAIPLHRNDGTPFPDRELVILIAAAVILATLLVEGISLPWLLSRLGLKAEDHQTEQNKARLKAARAALDWLIDHTDSERGEGGADPAAESLRARYETRIRLLESATPSDDTPDDEADDAEMKRYRELRLKMLSIERSTLLGLRDDGRLDPQPFRSVEKNLDHDEVRIRDS